VLSALGAKKSQSVFGHGCWHRLGALMLCDSYHCSRYNTNTGVLTAEMFHAVFADVRRLLDSDEQPALMR
jgi:uracil-DNA glycosylase